MCEETVVISPFVGMVGTSSKEMGSLSVPISMEEKNRVDVMAALSSFSYSFCSVSMVMSNKVSRKRLHHMPLFRAVLIFSPRGQGAG